MKYDYKSAARCPPAFQIPNYGDWREPTPIDPDDERLEKLDREARKLRAKIGRGNSDEQEPVLSEFCHIEHEYDHSGAKRWFIGEKGNEKCFHHCKITNEWGDGGRSFGTWIELKSHLASCGIRVE